MATSERYAGRSGHSWRRLYARVRRNQSACHLCGKPIDKSLPWPDPWSFSVDHVEPRGMNPELAEVYENLRAAHLKCNRDRGVRGLPAQPTSRDW